MAATASTGSMTFARVMVEAVRSETTAKKTMAPATSRMMRPWAIFDFNLERKVCLFFDAAAVAEERRLSKPIAEALSLVSVAANSPTTASPFPEEHRGQVRRE